MGWVTGLAVYAVIWWLVIFMVLPWGVRPVEQDEVIPGHDPGAPRRHRLPLRMAITTILAGIVWLGVYWVIDSGLVSFRQP